MIKKRAIFGIISILLMFILVGTLSFQEDISFTGNIIKELDPKGVFYGIYSFTPFINTPSSFDPSLYDKISTDLKGISSCVEKGGSLSGCMASRSLTKDLEWELDCQKGIERIFYDTAQLYSDCLSSTDSGCVCEKEFGSSEYIFKQQLEGEYRILLQKKEDGSLLLTDSNDVLSEKIPLGKNTIDYYPSTLSFIYQNNALLKSGVYRGPIAEVSNPPPSFVSTRLLLYKHKVGESMKIDVVEEQNGKIILPSGAILPTKEGLTTNLKPRSCSLPPKNIVKFCVHTGKKYLLYDEIDQLVKEREVVIRFGAHLPDSPPPLLDFSVTDMPKKSLSLLYRWDESVADDTARYSLYASSQSLSSIPTKEIALLSSTQSVSLLKEDAIMLNSVPILESCTHDYASKKCFFKTTGKDVSLLPNQLYSFMKTSGKLTYLYILEVPSDGPYETTITAVDRNNNEIDNVKQKLSVKSVSSVDDIPPSSEGTAPLLSQLLSGYSTTSSTLTFPYFTLPKRDIDNSLLSDFSDFAVYYKKNSAPAENDLLSSYDGMIVTLQSDGKLIVPFFSSSPKPNDKYFFVVVSRDSSLNPNPSQYTLKELGGSIQELTIPS